MEEGYTIVLYSRVVNGHTLFVNRSCSAGVRGTEIGEVTHSQEVPVCLIYGNYRQEREQDIYDNITMTKQGL